MTGDATLQGLRGRHPGAAFAVVGSAPSAVLFDPGACDVSIAVNGAALLGHRFDYFLSADRAAPERRWFTIDCARVRVIAAAIASRDLFLYPEGRNGSLRRLAVNWREQGAVELPAPVPPHRTYWLGAPTPERLRALRERSADRLLVYATIAGQAVQLAHLMGAGSLHLYGCAFSPATTGRPDHYHYPEEPERIGSIRGSQVRQMDRYLAILRAAGVRVVVHGETSLSEHDELSRT